REKLGVQLSLPAETVKLFKKSGGAASKHAGDHITHPENLDLELPSLKIYEGTYLFLEPGEEEKWAEQINFEFN
ncbi:MAG: hypothetical protein V2I33_25110, partial [Kangiellaceae bacterium]|nr:hypothetical protein [Kangiellaceae bacterium]